MRPIDKSLVVLALLGIAACGSDTNTTTVVSPVAVSSVFPGEARIGESITVHGQNFGASQGTSTLSINGAVASHIDGWTDSRIVATVPAGASTGNVVVTVDGVAGAPGYLVVPWPADDPDNVPISGATGEQAVPQLVSDGAGGAIAVWQDARTGTRDIYAQRVDRAGTVRWSADGVAISTAAGDQLVPQIIADSAGGAIIVWQDLRDGLSDIYAQRVNANGAVQWTADGVAIVAAADAQDQPQLVSDGAGGAIIAWRDNRNGDFDIYAQRVNSAGAALWSVGGVAISIATGNQSAPRLVPDGKGGAIIVWQDRRGLTLDDVYAQRIDADGVVQWTANAVDIVTATDNQEQPRLVSDGAGGAIIVWRDNRTGAPAIYAQRVNSVGATEWAGGGIEISSATGFQQDPQLVPDGAGGAIIVWTNDRNGNPDIYAQRVDGAGAIQWAADGEPVCSAADGQFTPQLIRDGTAGGAILIWGDNRSVDSDVYAQRIDGTGRARWITDGVAVSTDSSNQFSPRLVADGAGGAIAVWMDSRNGHLDIYGQGVTASGQL